MRTETWYYCDRYCGYRTQDRQEMEEHEKSCTYESRPVWYARVNWSPGGDPPLRAESGDFGVDGKADQDRYCGYAVEVDTRADDMVYVTKFVRTEAELPAALEECKAKLREWLLHLAGEVDGLELNKEDEK